MSDPEQEKARFDKGVYDPARFFELALDGLCLANTDGYFLRINPAFMEMLGWPEEELLSRRFLDFVHPEDVESTLAAIQDLSLGKKVIGFENRYRCANGSWRWLSWRASAHADSGTIYAVAHDVTDLKLASQDADRARTAAEAASRSKSNFLANMSHELRTPLNSIIGYSEMLQEDFASGPLNAPRQSQAIEDLDRIRQAGRHLLTLINQVLDLSKVEAGRLEVTYEEIDIADLMSTVAGVVGPVAETNRTHVELQVPSDIGSLISDTTKLRQVLLNLASNAARFTHQGKVRLQVETLGELWLRFTVEDTGIGFDENDIERLFEPFTQGDASTTRRFGGTGLGLSISQRFTTLLGGTIGGTGVPGKGARFWVDLPRRPAQLGESADPADRAEAAPADVLVVYEDSVSRDLARRTVEQVGLSCVTARPGPECLSLVSAWTPRLVLVDVVPPGGMGWEILTMLRAIPGMANVPVVLTGVVDEGLVGIAVGVAGHLTRPISPGELERIVDQYDRRPGIPEALVVDDEADARAILVRLLSRAGWRSRAASNGEEARLAVHTAVPDLILLDLTMPGMDGFEFLDHLREEPDLADVPVIVVTARDLTREDRERLDGRVSRVIHKGESQAQRLRAELARFARLRDSR